MDFKKINNKHFLITIVALLAFHSSVYSQGTDISGRKLPMFYFGLSAGPAQTYILNDAVLSVSELSSGKKISYYGDLSAGVLITNYFGLSAGIGYSSYSSQLSLDSYESSFNTTDSENETYERRITADNIMELQKISFLNVPVSLNFSLPFNNNKLGIFLQTAINLSFPANSTYTSSGTFTYKGYYPAYNVLLEDLPAYGFPGNINNQSGGKLELKSMTMQALATVGLEVFVNKKIQIAAGVCYNRSLSNISDYASPDKFQLSSDTDQINSLMGGSSKATVQSMGLKIIFRYYLK